MLCEQEIYYIFQMMSQYNDQFIQHQHNQPHYHQHQLLQQQQPATQQSQYTHSQQV